MVQWRGILLVAFCVIVCSACGGEEQHLGAPTPTPPPEPTLCSGPCGPFCPDGSRMGVCICEFTCRCEVVGCLATPTPPPSPTTPSPTPTPSPTLPQIPTLGPDIPCGDPTMCQVGNSCRLNGYDGTCFLVDGLRLMAMCVCFIPTPTPPPDRCRNNDDCQQSKRGPLCLAPGGFAGCGSTPIPVPTQDQCTTNADCIQRVGGPFICTFVTPTNCIDNTEGYTCVAGCVSDSDCPSDQACGASHRCVPRPCVSDADCPRLFACYPLAGSNTQGCTRRPCEIEVGCDSGFCVNQYGSGSYCYDQLGTCFAPPA
jgi:hypothetical protein